METVEDWVSLREFARRREVALSAVQKAIESGRVTAVKRDEKGRLTGIEMNLATAQWNGNTDLDQAARNGKVMGATQATTAREAAPQSGGGDNPAGAAQLPLDAPAAAAATSTNDEHGYYAARAEREKFQAKRAELDYLERVGELVSVTQVREQEFAVFRKLRDNLTAIGDRLAARLAAETDPVRVQHLISEEIRKALHELSRALGVDAARGIGERPSTLQ